MLYFTKKDPKYYWEYFGSFRMTIILNVHGSWQ